MTSHFVGECKYNILGCEYLWLIHCKRVNYWTQSDRSLFRAIYFHSSSLASPPFLCQPNFRRTIRSSSYLYDQHRGHLFPQPLYHGALLNFSPPDTSAQFILCLCTGDRVPSRSIVFSGGEVLARSAAGALKNAVDTAFARNGFSTGGSDL